MDVFINPVTAALASTAGFWPRPSIAFFSAGKNCSGTATNESILEQI
jgi:hypothetical protein